MHYSTQWRSTGLPNEALALPLDSLLDSLSHIHALVPHQRVYTHIQYTQISKPTDTKHMHLLVKNALRGEALGRKACMCINTHTIV